VWQVQTILRRVFVVLARTCRATIVRVRSACFVDVAQQRTPDVRMHGDAV